MAYKNLQKKSERTAKQGRRDKAIYAVLIGFVVLFVATYWLKSLTIGGDIKYHIFVEALPIAIGIALFIFNRKKLLNPEAMAAVTNIWHKIGYSALLLLCVSLLSYVTLGTFTTLVFELANYNKANSTKQETVILPIEEFYKGSGSRAKNSIRFRFKGEKEHIRVNRNYINQFRAESTAKHRIKLQLREGIWNHYIVEDWDIVQ